MSGFSWVSVVSIFCYLFLLSSFVSVRKPRKKIISAFMLMLLIMILWNGGSLCMRLQLFGLVDFWHHVSLLGIMMVPAGYFHFTTSFLDVRNSRGTYIWFICFLGIFVANCITNFFVPLPDVVVQNGQTEFLYHYDWEIYLLLVFIVASVVHLAVVAWRHCRGNKIAFQQLLPVLIGLLIMTLGHVIAFLPAFVGFPVDMLSGVINAFFLFYALYKKKLFRMSILLSKYSYAILSLLLGIIIFSNCGLPVIDWLINTVGFNEVGAQITVYFALAGIIVVIFIIIKNSLNTIFSRTEQHNKNALVKLSEEVTHMMSVEDILPLLADTLRTVSDVDRLYILIRDIEGEYRIEYTIRPLEEKNFYFRDDHPLVAYLKQHNEGLKFADFTRTTTYRSMWENEKSLFNNLNIEYVIPLTSEDELVGIVLLSDKQGKPAYHPSNDCFYRSCAETCAAAIKNAYIYEQAIKDAQKDELTGLINVKFFHELLNQEFEKYKTTALSLCIMNVDDFKKYNQLYGTHEGDLALQRIAGILSSGISELCFAARIGGDEFALILPGYDIYTAKCLVENLTEQINEISPTVADSVSRITVSAGICAVPYMASTAKELFRNTDMTVYAVKRSGKNDVKMYSAEMYPKKSEEPIKSGYDENASTIYALSAAIDAKDHYTCQHSKNVAYYASALAKGAGMEQNIIDIVREAGLLHDIGKIGIREDILNKPGRLTAEQYEAVKKHVENAVDIIHYLPSLDYVIPAVLSHHERYDGTGYPNNLAEDNIPLTGRILCIADAFDAMTSIRNYKDAISQEEAVKELRAEAGRQFDPQLVRTFIELLESGEIKLAPKNPTTSETDVKAEA